MVLDIRIRPGIARSRRCEARKRHWLGLVHWVRWYASRARWRFDVLRVIPSKGLLLQSDSLPRGVLVHVRSHGRLDRQVGRGRSSKADILAWLIDETMVRVEGVYPVVLLSKVVDIAVCSRFLEWRPLEGRFQGTIGHGGEWLDWPTLVACLPLVVILMGVLVFDMLGNVIRWFSEGLRRGLEKEHSCRRERAFELVANGRATDQEGV